MADDDIQTPAGEAAPQSDTSVVPPSEGAAEPSPTAAEEIAAVAPEADAAPVAEGDALKRADDEPTLLEGAVAPGAEKKEEVAKEEAVDADAEGDDEKKAETEKTEKADGAEPDKKEGDAEAEAEADTEKEAKPEVEPIDYKWTLPETFKADDALKADVHGALDQFRADPTNPQPLIDLHTREMERYAHELEREQHRVFAETRSNWRKEWMADPEIGGSGYDTALAAIARMRDMFASSAKPGTEAYENDLKAFDGMLRVTGVGDHPIFARFLHNVAGTFDRPAPAPAEINPPKDIGRQNARGLLYDNPRSDPNRQQ